MNTISKYFLSAAAAAVAFTGCIQETAPQGSTATAPQVGESASGMDAIVASMNSQMTVFNTLGRGSDDEYHGDFGYPSFMICWDLMCNDMATYTSSYHQFQAFEGNRSLSGDYIYSSMFWYWYYKQIFIANSILGMQSEGVEAGIARAYRAMCYLDLARLYDYKANKYTSAPAVVDIAVPIVTETTTDLEMSNNPRAKTADVYALVESDLLQAEVDLDGYKRSAVNTPDQTVVWGLLARMYLERGSRFNSTEDFEKAAEYADKVITSGRYSPVTQSQWFDKATGFNSSTSTRAWLWSVNISREDRVVTTGIINFTSMMSSECPYGYALPNGSSDGPQKCIDKKFYESIPSTDWRKNSWIAPDYRNADLAIKGREWALEAFQPYVQVKFRPGQGETDDYMIGSAVDIPLMRVEEMYLIKAEATGLARGESAGRQILEDFVQTYRDPAYAYNASAGISENVLKQKRIEFWGEGICFFDYKRLGKSIERGYEGTNHYDATRFNTDGLAPWFNFCISRSELNSNEGIQCDNPDPSGRVTLWQ